jgi:hypothetical protein
MQFTTVLTLSTSLLAAEVSALHADPNNPVGIHNPNLYNTKHSLNNAAANPNANPNPNPEIPAYMAPVISSMASAMAATMVPTAASTSYHASMHSNGPMAYTNAPMAPHSNLPTYSDVPMYSQGSMYSHLAMSSSAVSIPYARPSAPISSMYNAPMGSMLTKASSTPLSSMATPSPTHAFKHQVQRPAFHPAQAQAPEGKIAPINPMPLGSNVAPVELNHHHGADEGNAFCMGQCYPSEEEAQCAKPMVRFFSFLPLPPPLLFFLFNCHVDVGTLMLCRLRLFIDRVGGAGLVASLLVISRSLVEDRVRLIGDVIFIRLRCSLL